MLHVLEMEVVAFGVGSNFAKTCGLGDCELQRQ